MYNINKTSSASPSFFFLFPKDSSVLSLFPLIGDSDEARYAADWAGLFDDIAHIREQEEEERKK